MDHNELCPVDPAQEIDALYSSLLAVTIHRHLLDTPLMTTVLSFLRALRAGEGEPALELYTRIYRQLWDEGFPGLGQWLGEQLRYDENPYSLRAQRRCAPLELAEAARQDIDTLSALARTSCTVYIDRLRQLLPPDACYILAHLPLWSTNALDFDVLTRHYEEHGVGLYARYRAFLWEEGQLIPVPDPDCPMPEDLLGYELQRDQVEANTRQMFTGRQANNVLLFGDGGTGKSATVKSMLYLPGMEDLRLIEIQKENITGLPSLIRSLEGRRQKFILFIDDLAFDQDDKTYSSMKTILEGSLERRPVNVAIYATSNRRHLVRQTFSERAGEEVDTFETISEKTALAERFGLRIPYLTMNKVSYLALVEHLAKQAGIDMPRDQLHAQAMTWEIRHSGRTPRVARQFIASLHV